MTIVASIKALTQGQKLLQNHRSKLDHDFRLGLQNLIFNILGYRVNQIMVEL